ncbi:MAG: DUF2577 family protein [Anaerotignum sp.]|nr:DUF2577 family protein [Anaerotignum sp.]MBR5121979.1 DUF2577 family protein [Anaerotignum sp.]
MTPHDDPYQSIVEMMREEGGADKGASPYFIGEVVTASPLVIKIGDLQIERKNIKVNAFLLSGYTRRMSITSIGFSTCTTQDSLSAGTKVLMVQSADQQQFIVICPLV